MSYKALLVNIFFGVILSGCSLFNEKKNTFLALSQFTDPIFTAGSPKAETADINNELAGSDFAISEELARELKEAEALLNEPTIFSNN